MMIYKDPYGNELSAGDWASLYENRSVEGVWSQSRAISEIEFKGENITVSTVWTGMSNLDDYGQFETMVFSDDESKSYDKFSRKYCTKQESLEGHFEITKAVTDLLVGESCD